VAALIVTILAALAVEPVGDASAQALHVGAPAVAQPPSSVPPKTFKLSEAVFRFLTHSLGVEIGPSRTLPDPERGPIELDVGGPVTLPLDLPSGVSAPEFTRTNISIATGSGRLTAVATGPGAHLALTIAHASSAALDVGDLVSSLRLSLPVPGETVSVTAL
jgi:hypothetical protein